jgi:hypothetical protein
MAKQTKILHYRTNLPAGIPTVGNIDLGELAVNTFKGVLYTKKDDGAEAINQVGLLKDDPAPQQSATLDSNQNFISNVLDPVLPQDAVNLRYLETQSYGYVKISQEIATYQSSIDVINAFDLTAEKIYQLVFTDVTTDSPSTEDIFLRFSTDNLTTEINTGYESSPPEGGGNVTDLNTNTEIFLGTVVSGPTSPLSGQCAWFDVAVAGHSKSGLHRTVSNVGGGQPVRAYTYGFINTSTLQFNSFRLFASSGNIKGKFVLYELATG